MTLKHERIEIWDQLIPALDGIPDERSNFRIHPWLNYTTDGVVVFVCLKTVDSEALRMDAELDPPEEEFWGWLWAFEATNVMTVALTLTR